MLKTIADQVLLSKELNSRWRSHILGLDKKTKTSDIEEAHRCMVVNTTL